MIKNSLDNIAILIDFDGTITTKDTNDLLVSKQSNPQVHEIAKMEDEIGFKDFFQLLFSEIKITEEEYLRFILNEIEIEDGFYDFYKKCRLYNIPLAIVSGGFENGIIPFLEKHNIYDVDIFANKLIFDGNKATINFYHNLKDCCDIGSCGNCKVLHYEKFKENKKKVIFIGDGITDRAVASKADVVFAKDGLLRYCKDKNIHCIPWNNFVDIAKIIF